MWSQITIWTCSNCVNIIIYSTEGKESTLNAMQQLSFKEHFQQGINRELWAQYFLVSIHLLYTIGSFPFYDGKWLNFASRNIFGHTDHVSSMQNVPSKPLEFSVIFYMPIITLKTLQHIPHCTSHWINYHFCYFAALLKLHCPIKKPWPPFAAALFSLCQVKSPFSPLGSISASFLQLLICFCASVIPGLNVHLFTAATSWSCFLKNRTLFRCEVIVLAIGT